MRSVSGQAIFVFIAVLFVSLLLTFSIVFFPVQLTLKFFAFLMFVISLFLAFILRNKTNAEPKKLLLYTLGGLVFFSITWPRYVFLSLGSLPKVNPFNLSHLLAFLLIFFVLLLNPKFSRKYSTCVSNNKFVFSSVLFLLIWQLISSIQSTYYPFTLSAFLSILVLYTFFFIGIAFAALDSAPAIFFRLLIVSTIVVIFFGLLELLIQKNPFANFISYDLNGYESVLIQNITSEKLRAGSHRIQSVFTHPILLAQYLVGVIPVVCGIAFLSKSLFKKFFYSFIVIASLFLLYKTGSRSGIFSLAITMAYMILMIWLRALIWGKTSKLVAVFFLPIFLFSIPIVYLSLNELVIGHSQEEYQSSQYRVQMLVNAVHALRDDWVFGFGSGTGVLKAGIKSTSGLISIDSYYLSLALEGGYLATILFICIFLYTFIKSSVFSLKERGNTGFELVLLNSATLGFFLVFSILSTMHNLTLYWILISLSFFFYNKMLSLEENTHATK